MKNFFALFLAIVCLGFGACAEEEAVPFVGISGISQKSVRSLQKSSPAEEDVKYDMDASGCFIARHEVCYDQQGRILQWKSYDSENKIYLIKEYQYGKYTIEKIRVDDNTDIRVIDANGNILKCIVFFGENRKYSIDYLYDSQNRKINEINYDQNGKITAFAEYIYEDVLTKNYIDKDMLSGDQYSIYIYDEKGNLISFSEYANGVARKTEYKYNSQNKCTGFVRFSEDTIERTEYRYDENGNCILNAVYEENDIRERSEYQYDEKGNCILSICYDALANQTTKEINSYTSEGKIAESRYFEGEDLCGYVQYLYTEKVQTVIRYNKNGEISAKEVYEYDDMGREIKFSFYGYEGDALIWWRETNYYPDGQFAKSIGYYENGQERSHHYRDSLGNTVSSSSGPNDPFVTNIG